MSSPDGRMIVCLCYAVSDKEISRMARETGIGCVRECAKVCGAGTKCGTCVPSIEKILKETRTQADPSGRPQSNDPTAQDPRASLI
ncbi:MAG: (2Fe-2S)-binding protein [Bdellovibrionales bacterium]|nr:(2Fe-2S)-binding protein [Bdellovibrionales bacterium]